MSKKLEIEDIKPGLIIINNVISSIYQYKYIERIDEVVNNTLTITSCCRNLNTTNNEVDWYSMSTIYLPLKSESIYNCRRARINEVWYFNLNTIKEGRSLYE